MTSARILEEGTCHRARNLCVFSRVQKGTPGLTHQGCVLQRVSLGALRSRDETKYSHAGYFFQNPSDIPTLKVL